MKNLGKYRNPFPGFWKAIFENSRFWHLIVNTGEFFSNFARELKTLKVSQSNL
jgi:hypothetical protein